VEQQPRNESDNRRTDADPPPDGVLGGADAVEKTTYVGDVHGADARGRESGAAPVTASVRSGGSSPLAWIAALLALGALAVYAAGLFG